MPPTSTDTPQCPICHEAITPSMKLVVSPDCGHVMCLACSERFFAGLKRKGCPMCRNPTKPDSLVPVYVDFRSSTTNRTHESDCVEERMKDATDSLSKAAFSNGDIVKSEDREFRSTLELQGTHVIGILKSCLHPEEGQLSASRDRNDQGQIFTRTGKFLTNVAKASDITGAIRGILHEIGAQLREYQETYHAISSIIDTRERLQKQVDDLKARLANEELNHVRDVDQITNNASENARQLQDDAKERETELHRQMARLRDDLRAETLMRKKAVQWEIELVREVDKYKIKAYNNRKKLLAERKHSAELQRRVDKMSGGSPRRLPLPSSDDSLEIEGLEDEIVEGPPPSGNLPTSQGSSSPPRSCSPRMGESSRTEPPISRDVALGRPKPRTRSPGASERGNGLAEFRSDNLDRQTAIHAEGRPKETSKSQKKANNNASEVRLAGSMARVPTMRLAARTRTDAMWNVKEVPKKRRLSRDDQ